MKLIVLAVLTVAGVLANRSSFAGSNEIIAVLSGEAIGSKGLPDGWQVVTRHGEAALSRETILGQVATCLRSDKASFAIQTPTSIDLVVHPYLRWRWLVRTLPPNGDVRKAKTNDQAAQLFVAIDGFPKKAISYVWDSNAPVGTGTEEGVWPILSIRVVTVESGSQLLGKWVTEERNVQDDFAKLFGKKAMLQGKGVRFQINSQHTRAQAEACIGSVEFARHPEH